VRPRADLETRGWRKNCVSAGDRTCTVFFFLTRSRPQWPVAVSLQRLRGLPRDLLPLDTVNYSGRYVYLESTRPS
jgi:hypothetical protein